MRQLKEFTSEFEISDESNYSVELKLLETFTPQNA